MKTMINYKMAYFSFTVKRTFFTFFKSKKPIENTTAFNTINDYSFGSSSEVISETDISKLSIKKAIIDPKIDGQHFELAIIGGGSAGIAMAHEAFKLGLKTIIFDYVEPSPQGTKWGLGGTCANVGCIPKKLMHTSALHFEHIMHSYDYGWNLSEKNHYFQEENKIQQFQKESFSWDNLVSNIQAYIKSTNFGYKAKMQEYSIPYVNALATLYDKNTILFSPKFEVIQNFVKKNVLPEKPQENFGKISADYIVVATGGRPQFLPEKDCKNCKQLAITSDDLFSLPKPPNKTLIVGGGYIALECAGMLSGMGFPVNIMTRGLYLRTHDRGMADMIMEDLQRINNLKVIPASLPYEINDIDSDRKLVKWKSQNKDSKEIGQDEFNTVLIAIGRIPNTSLLNLEKVGIKTHPSSKKIIGGFQDEAEQTSVENIFALGDILENIPELTPVASKSAVLLAKRIAIKKSGNKDPTLYKKYFMDYDYVPTTIFTPNEYSYCGLSEEKAIAKFGKDNIEVYHSKYTPLEEYLNSRLDNNGEPLKRMAYCKVICNKKEEEKVVGIHYLGPNAGEIMQGLTVAMKLGLKKKDLDAAIGIHPTTAEEFVNLKATKASGENYEKKSC